MKELIDRIEHDIKCAEVRRDAFDKGSHGYEFNKAIVLEVGVGIGIIKLPF